MILADIISEDMLEHSEHSERIDNKVIKYSEVKINKYMFNSCILLANKAIHPNNIYNVDSYFIEKYNMTGTYKSKQYNEIAAQELFLTDSEDSEEDKGGKFYGKRAVIIPKKK